MSAADDAEHLARDAVGALVAAETRAARARADVRARLAAARTAGVSEGRLAALFTQRRFSASGYVDADRLAAENAEDEVRA